MRKKLEVPEKAPYGVVTAYRSRGNYLQRLEQFEKAISSYDEALRWNADDVRSLLGRSTARVKSSEYVGALADVARSSELDPENMTAKQIRVQTEYEKCSFGRALLMAHRGRRIRQFPNDFAESVRQAEETLRECTSKSAIKTLALSAKLCRDMEFKRVSVDISEEKLPKRKSRMNSHPTHQVQELSRVEKNKADAIYRLMASQYLERMAHDKYFLVALCKDERLASANKQGSIQLQQLADKGLADLEKRQAVLRERRPLYAARAAGAAARARLRKARNERIHHAQAQHIKDAQRLISTTQAFHDIRDTAKCLEHAEFAIGQISRKPGNLLPSKDKFLQELYNIVAEAFLYQKRVKGTLSESDREKRAFMLLGIGLEREPSHDSVLRVRPQLPRDCQNRTRALERALSLSASPPERCYFLHELARIYSDTKQVQKGRFFIVKCQSEARAAGLRAWLLNATFLLARCHVMQNNRPEAKSTLLEGVALAKSFGFFDISAFFETCANVSTEGEVAATNESVEKREQAMVSLMQDDDMKSAAQHLFKRMSAIPAARRFSVLPGSRTEQSPSTGAGRRVSIMPNVQEPARVMKKSKQVVGFQDFDI